jgi:hypothetical protein
MHRDHRQDGTYPSVDAGSCAVEQYIIPIEREGALAPIKFIEIIVSLLYEDGDGNHDCSPFYRKDRPQKECGDEAQGDMTELIGDPGIGQSRCVLRIFAAE